MRIGFNLPQIGPAASPDGMVRVARRAEELGYDSVWVTERLLFPTNPQTPYMATPDGSLPEAYKISFDPIESLTFVAGQTSRIGLGTSVLDIPYYNPVMLARRLTTLDVLSNGRLRLGLGQGWSQDEFDAVGASMKGRGKRADEFLSVLKAIWTTDPVEFKGEFYQVPKSIIQPKPVQKPHPPIWIGGESPPALRRAGQLGDAWYPIGTNPQFPVGSIQEYTEYRDRVRDNARKAGRDPDTMDFAYSISWNNQTEAEMVNGERRILTGTPVQLADDVKRLEELGVNHLLLNFQSETLDATLARMDDFASKVRPLI